MIRKMNKKLKPSVIEAILQDASLFALVSEVGDIKPISMVMTIRRNGNKVNQYAVVKAVADYMKVSPDDLVEQVKVHPEAA